MTVHDGYAMMNIDMQKSIDEDEVERRAQTGCLFAAGVTARGSGPSTLSAPREEW
jgi:hypothetical protein